ncbi:MAG: demethylmenaquinone methyltransferase / 2-methoxy-6-polyprenyl,4-benzoquinol methylase [Frankiaceae bacterium]|nr:demethylmenaquinone methyltransferase / 2-methoxy-6-polyprenyl,4-benzoquinol methylase [Frankiaceae bacterium]
MTRAKLDRRPDEVAAMFDGVAPRYDLMNRVMTFGLESLWRRTAQRAVNPQAGLAILDLAAGTAASSVLLARAGATVVAADFSLGMLREGRRHAGIVHLVAGDALRLPFAGASFDVVTISFGLRNVADVDAALREMLRVTRPGGRLVIAETSQPPMALLRSGHRLWLRVLPHLAGRFSSNPDAYRYLTESTLAWPDAATLARRIASSGWADVGWRGLTFGVVALHRATRPA